MKFLLFNVVVLAALGYLVIHSGTSALFSGGVEGLAEAARRTVVEAADAVSKAESKSTQTAPPASPKSSPAPASNAPPASPPTPAASPPPAAVPSRADQPRALASVASGEALMSPPAPARVTPVEVVPIDSLSAVAPKRLVPPAPSGSPAAEDPIVARRRAEVLDGLPAQAMSGPSATVPSSRATPVVAKAAFMKPSERRTELDRLAEEMELLYAQKVFDR